MREREKRAHSRIESTHVSVAIFATNTLESDGLGSEDMAHARDAT